MRTAARVRKRPGKSMVLLVLVLTSCSGDPTPVATIPTPTPTPTPVSSPVASLAPQLIYPPDGATIVQNDPTTGCPFNPKAGYGHWETFTWAPVAGAIGYHLYFKHPAAQNPVIDQRVLETGFSHPACGAFVVDSNLAGWYWQVSAVLPGGSEGPASMRTIQFGICRLGTGPCNAS